MYQLSSKLRGLLSNADPYIRLAEVLVIGLAVLAFFLEFVDRREARIATMWQLASTDSPGQKRALEYLNELGEPLARLKADNAFLAGIRLRNATLVNASLSNVNLVDSDLRDVQLVNADLRERFSTVQTSGAPI